ncbi:MAG TPA: TetR/AcrR family transcriptional regulator [Gemmatimonadaceae bacterium]|nr:TetR/AcrR family transcriptional regulator [Gemmatimonadaceae bacterium]
MRDGSATRQRIIDATIECVARAGATEASMATIAAAAGVSKALLHYHHADRARLLAEVVAQLGERLAARERSALAGADGSKAIDALWRWLEGELARGELRVLLELSSIREPLVHDAAAAVAEARRIAAGRTTADLLRRLGLEPRVPAALLGEASVAFMNGLAIAGPVPGGDPRVAFDVFWLAMLGLAE